VPNAHDRAFVPAGKGEETGSQCSTRSADRHPPAPFQAQSFSSALAPPACQPCFWTKGVGDKGVNSASGAMCTCYAGSAEISGANLMWDLRDINRDAKWRRLAMKESPGGVIGPTRDAWRC
jgi:hypothetical protein